MTSPAPTPEPPAVVVVVGGSGRCCTVPGCGRVHKAHGYCRTHYRRWQRHGDPRAEVPVRHHGSSYRAVLARLRAVRGAPEGQRCAGCAGRAAVWAYDGTDPQDRTEPGRGRRYSVDPDRYRPLCRFCHRRTVLARVAEVPMAVAAPVPVMDVDRAARLYLAGASAAGIAGLLHVSPDAVLRALRARGITIRPTRSTYSRTLSGPAAAPWEPTHQP